MSMLSYLWARTEGVTLYMQVGTHTRNGPRVVTTTCGNCNCNRTCMQPQTLLQHYPRPSPPQTPKQSINYSSLHIQQPGANTSTNPSTVPTHHTASKHGSEAVSPSAIVRAVSAVYTHIRMQYRHQHLLCGQGCGCDVPRYSRRREEKQATRQGHGEEIRLQRKIKSRGDEKQDKTQHPTTHTVQSPPRTKPKKTTKKQNNPPAPLQQASPGIPIRSEGSTRALRHARAG